MALQMRANPSYSLTAETVESLISWTDASFTAGTVNRQVLNTTIAVSGTAGNTGTTAAMLGPDNTLKPTRFAQPFAVFCNPNGAAAPAAANVSTLPLGLQNGVTGTLGSEYVIDFSAFPSDITGAQAAIVSNTRNAAVTQTAVVSAIDNVNKLVYVNVVNATTGALAANNATNTITLDIQFVENGFTS